MRIMTHLDNTLYLSSLWSDLSKWGHYFIVLNLRKPNLRSSLSQLSAPELVTAGAQMFSYLTAMSSQEQSRDRRRSRSVERSFHQKISGSWSWCWSANVGGRKGGSLPLRVCQGRLPWEQGKWSKTDRPADLGNYKILSLNCWGSKSN